MIVQTLVGGTRANSTAAAAPGRAVAASHLRLLWFASAIAPRIGESTAATSIESEIPHAQTIGPHSSGKTTPWM